WARDRLRVRACARRHDRRRVARGRRNDDPRPPPRREDRRAVNERILVVDDEQAIVDAVAYALRREGFDVETASDGREALEAARAAPYDVLVLDLMLPGMSGLD